MTALAATYARRSENVDCRAEGLCLTLSPNKKLFSSITTNEERSICCSLVNGFLISGSTLQSPFALPSEFQSAGQEAAGAESPLGLDEPTKVWKTGLTVNRETHIWSGTISVCLSEGAAWSCREFALRCGGYIVLRDPYEITFEHAIADAVTRGASVLAIRDYGFRIIDEYPIGGAA